MKYAVLGFSMVNNIIEADGRKSYGHIGGGGFYAFTGLRMAEPDSNYLTGAGPDYPELFGEWYAKNGMDFSGLRIKLDKTIFETIAYNDKGEYFEIDEGLDVPHLFNLSALSGEEIEEFTRDMKGLYVANPWLRQSPGVAELRKEKGFKIMWEYTVDEECQKGLKDYLDNCDIWSINYNEAKELFSVDSEDEAVSCIRRLGKPCFFRVGIRGSYMITADEIVFSPIIMLDGTLGVSETGCGNTSTAAAMWAFCEGYSLKEICVFANTVAAFNAQQYGPVPLIDDNFREKLFDTYRHYLKN